MKKYLKLFLILMIFFSIVGCSNTDNAPKKKETNTKQEEKVLVPKRKALED